MDFVNKFCRRAENRWVFPAERWQARTGGNALSAGEQPLWNAVYAAAHFKLNGAGDNKVLLILSDGNDTGSTHSFSSALEEVQRSGAVVYAIQYPDDLSTETPPANFPAWLVRQVVCSSTCTPRTIRR